jgi:sigma-B regulation protein RsbU (phosphoserine phosphatase)
VTELFRELGAAAGETLDERAERVSLLMATALMAAAGALWGAMYLALARPVSAAIPGAYSVVTILSLALVRVTGRIQWFRVSQVLLILSLPFALQTSLGGFEHGSAVSLWAFLPVLGSIVFHYRYSSAWLGLYLVSLGILGALNDRLRAAIEPLGALATSILWVGNVGGVSLVCFLVMRYFIDHVQRQRALGQAALAKVAEQAKELEAARARLEKEVEVARRIQLALLPQRPSVAGLEVATRMVPASEVGGDYFDCIPQDGGCWIGVGDVSGHGLTAGLITLMVQSIVTTLVDRDGTHPAELVRALNRVLYANVHHRLLKDEFVTFCALRYSLDGSIEVAGGHEPLVVLRARTRQCEVIALPGPWLAVAPDVQTLTVTTKLALEPGDVLVLHTDGVTEATNAEGEAFGLDRLCRAVEDGFASPVEQVRDAVFEALDAWQTEQRDDATLLVVRYRGEALTRSADARA